MMREGFETLLNFRHNVIPQSIFSGSDLSQSRGGTLHASHCHILSNHCWRLLCRADCPLQHRYSTNLCIVNVCVTLCALLVR